MENPGSIPGQKDLLYNKMATTRVFLHGKSHGQRNLVGYSIWGRKESDMTEQHLLFTSPISFFGFSIISCLRCSDTETTDKMKGEGDYS